jgi:hypothetical protein
MEISLQFDSSAKAAPVGWEAAVQAAADMLDTLIQDPISVTIGVGYGEIEGQSLASRDLGEGAPNGAEIGYGQLVTDLKAHPTSSLDQTFLNSLPATDPGNDAQYFISMAQEEALGLISPDTSGVAGYVGFAATPFSDDPGAGIGADNYDLVGDALQEITHALGRTMPPGFVTSMDLMAYGSNGQIDLTNGAPRTLSLDGGQTALATFDTSSDPGDFALGSPVDPFDAYLAPGTTYGWTTLDSEVMGALGFTVGSGTGDPNFVIQDTTTNQGSYTQGQAYTGPVSGLATEYAVNTSDTINITAEVPNVFIEVGYIPGSQSPPAMAGINVSMANGNNVVDSYAASSFLTGGSGSDTFYIDARTLVQNDWSTVVNFHTADQLTVWGVTANDFKLDWIGDTYGAPGATGLTGVLVPTTGGGPEIGFTLAGLTTADTAANHISTTFGSIDGNAYMAIQHV